MSAEIVQFPQQTKLTDIPGMMRLLADAIENGSIDGVEQVLCVTVREGGRVTVMGWGEVGSNFETVGVLAMAMNSMQRMFVADDEEE